LGDFFCRTQKEQKAWVRQKEIKAIPSLKTWFKSPLKEFIVCFR